MRKNGILMPIFSLPSRGGIGTLGKEAFRFVDFLTAAGQSYWQILPLCPTNFGDSPYQSFSAYAGNPYFIDPDELIAEGLLTEEEFASFDFGSESDEVDYEKLYNNRFSMLKLAFSRFSPDADYHIFYSENAYWLDDYSLFMAIKAAYDGRPWSQWPQSLKRRDDAALELARESYKSEIAFNRFVQYKFAKQWKALKKYANDAGIEIIGDIPIYVAYDSADVWASPSQFMLDSDGEPTEVSGCPPDAFSDDGQLWGNPLYNWAQMEKDGFFWWCRRMRYALTLYDIVRIDHFRGLESFYAIPHGEETAKNGVWRKGPDMALFDAFREQLGERLPIIAEDLGYMTPEVKRLLARSGFPGMKVMQFAFDSREESDYLPHNYVQNCVVYTGTHDNDTINGWTESAPAADVETARRYLGVGDEDGLAWPMMRGAMMSVADTCILMMPDLIGLGSEGRINTPSTLGGNWKWRIDGGCINDWLAKIIYENTLLYGRAPKKEKKDAK